MHLVSLPALSDNYIWLLHDDDGHAVVVDPGEAAPVEQALRSHQLQLTAILLTHHHADHIGGAAELAQRHHATVYAPHDERIGLPAQRVGEGDEVRIDSPALHFRVMEVPAHTRSHVAYAGEGMLFCGDTMFSLGCGRLFEGTAEQMLAALDRFAALPDQTLACPAHEYTAANGRFALTVEPDNRALQQRVRAVAQCRAQQLPSLPVSLGSERDCNPFLRVDQPEVIAWCDRHGDASSRAARLASLRSAKDQFRG